MKLESLTVWRSPENLFSVRKLLAYQEESTFLLKEVDFETFEKFRKENSNVEIRSMLIILNEVTIWIGEN